MQGVITFLGESDAGHFYTRSAASAITWGSWELQRRIARSAVLAAVIAIVWSAFATPALAANSRQRGARHRPAPIANRAGLAPSNASFLPVAQDSNVEGRAGGLAANFNGVSSRDSAVTNFGAQFEPPDQGLCAGNGFVVEMVNSAYTVYRPNGSVVTGPFNVNGPFDEGLVEFTSDPRCYYDASTHTWFATILFINSTSTASHLDI